jgi:hypothetical protein
MCSVTGESRDARVASPWELLNQIFIGQCLPRMPHPSGGGMNSLSPDTGVNRPLLHSSFACSMRSRREEALDCRSARPLRAGNLER